MALCFCSTTVALRRLSWRMGIPNFSLTHNDVKVKYRLNQHYPSDWSQEGALARLLCLQPRDVFQHSWLVMLMERTTRHSTNGSGGLCHYWHLLWTNKATLVPSTSVTQEFTSLRGQCEYSREALSVSAALAVPHLCGWTALTTSLKKRISSWKWSSQSGHPWTGSGIHSGV